MIVYFEKGSSFHLVRHKLDKTQPQRFCADAYFNKKTLSATPRPLYRWKAETLSFLQVLLVWGINILSLLIIYVQTIKGCVSKVPILGESQIHR